MVVRVAPNPQWDDPTATSLANPVPGMDVARWLTERGVALTGCDTWS